MSPPTIFKLRRGSQYTITLKHEDTNKANGVPDYDWQAQVDDLPYTTVLSGGATHSGADRFTVIQNAWILDNGDGLLGEVNQSFNSTDHTTGKVARLLPVVVEDNIPATGVDEVSLTAKPTDIGYQSDYWIMAPSGNDPLGNACSNEMKFMIPATLELEMTFPQGAQAPATPTPGTVTLNPSGALCAWHGESPTTTETPAVIWKIGDAGQTKTEVDLPIAVKTMKRRTVRVAVWPVNLPSEQGIFATVAARNDFEAELKAELDQVFAFQINAWFDVSVGLNKTFDYLDGMSGTTPYTLSHGSKEKAMIDVFRDEGFDINVFLINNVRYIWNPLTQASILGSSYPMDDPESVDRENCAVVNMSAYYTGSTGQKHSIAHEIGHLLVGPGHPDQYRAEDPNSGGLAPLQSLTGEHPNRLMHSNSATGKLLVKGEWDAAEGWLVNTLESP